MPFLKKLAWIPLVVAGGATPSFAATAEAPAVPPALAPNPAPSEPTPSTVPVEYDPTVILNDLPMMPQPPPNEPEPPKPPKLPEEAADPAEIGIPILDAALRGEAPRSLLPYWHGYPWQKITHPVTWTRETIAMMKTNGRPLLATVPRDYEWFCPNYPNLNEEERAIFWTRLLSVMSELESSFNPLRTYHSKRVEWGLFSTGLMMLSLPSSKQSRFGCDMIKTQDDLFEWRKNLGCSIKIMASYVSEDQVIASHSRTDEDGGRWMGLARYWEPYRIWRLEYPELRQALLTKIKHRRKLWQLEGAAKLHPAYKDSDYEAKKETTLDRIYRLMNAMPFCLTGSPDDFEEGDFLEDPPPFPRARPRMPWDPPAAAREEPKPTTP